jgi:hypothetical protein
MAAPHQHRTRPSALRTSIFTLALAHTALAHAADGKTTTMIDAIKMAETQEAGIATKAEISCTEQPCVYVVAIQKDDLSIVHVHIPTKGIESISDSSSVTAKTREPEINTASRTGVSNEKIELKLGAGQIAGMGNAILHPALTLGTSGDFHLRDFPQVDTDFNASVILGKTESTQHTTKPGLQELRVSAHSIYNFYNDRGISKAGVGLYVDFAQALHHQSRYVPQDTSSIYAAEENESIQHQLNTGLDFRISIHNDRAASDLHNVIFLSGNRVGPNLLTYQPLLGFMWSNKFHFSGSESEPGLSFMTDMNFYFAKKNGVKVFNSHDGLGGTKREIYLSYGLEYTTESKTAYTIRSYGFNNLNRGASTMAPSGFKDGLSIGLARPF